LINRIGVAGAAGAGKTTVAKHLVENHGFKLLGFATPLYLLGDIHREPESFWHSLIWGWTDEYLNPLGYGLREKTRFTDDAWNIMQEVPVQEGKNRTLLQLLGTEVGRALDENIWTNIFEAKVEELGPDAKIINDNLRFENEMDSLERLGFFTVYIETPDEIRSARYEAEYGVPMNPAQLSHASEKDLPKIRERCDVLLVNDDKLTKQHLTNWFTKLVTDPSYIEQVSPYLVK
jgi:hypothetical protein